MRGRVSPADWKASGIEGLERIAEDAVRYDGHALVVAGPGAGKTELLAQKACFLLQTGLCPPPRRILAVSFKRDAARNLQDRVLDRCGEELGRRFHSFTFDAFAKSIVDRFGQALPEEWRPTPDYVLDFNIEKQYVDRLLSVPTRFSPPSRGEIDQIQAKAAYKLEFAGRRLLELSRAAGGLEQQAALATWKFLLRGQAKSLLNFHMIGRLAEHIFVTNPKVLEALRASYAFAFLDEFQDTTSIQYDLTLTLFHGAACQLTAVGDAKQSIMRWALALTGIFDRFQKDFAASVFRPVRNYRSAPNLVGIIGNLASAIETGSVPPVAVDDGSNGQGECRVLHFQNSDDEVIALTELIRGWVEDDGVPPEQICLLTKQTPDRYTTDLTDALQAIGIQTRIEAALQDLMSEPITDILLDALMLANRSQDPQAWQRLESFYLSINGCDSDRDARLLSKELADFLNALKVKCRASPLDEQGVAGIVDIIVDFIGLASLTNRFTQYTQGNFLETQLKVFAADLGKLLLADRSWDVAINRLMGIGSIPIMTVHKSKGLEYHTIVFIGLEDYVFRNLQKIQDDEETCVFFVAFSRARKRIIFTFSGERNGRNQTSDTVEPLYELLLKSGVQREEL